MKTSELYAEAEPVQASFPIEEVEEGCFNDDDFWEAIDLLESAKKSVDAVLRYAEGLTQGREKILKNLSDDIGVFVSHFVETE
jgi:hypothetical protein